jgi:hypothetical protein
LNLNERGKENEVELEKKQFLPIIPSRSSPHFEIGITWRKCSNLSS